MTQFIWFRQQKNKKARYNSSLISACFLQRSLINEKTPQSFFGFDFEIDSALPVLCFPLFDSQGFVIGVVENHRENPFSLLEEGEAQLFIEKFSKIYHLIASNENIRKNLKTIASDADNLISLFKKWFLCQEVDFWIYTENVTTLSKYIEKKKKFVETDSQNYDEILKAMEQNVPLIENDGNYAFDPPLDQLSFICCPVLINKDSFAVSLLRTTPFSSIDVLRLTQLTPLLSHTMYNSAGKTDFAPKLQALLDVAEILSGVLDIDQLIPVIMNRSCELLKAERSTLFLIDVTAQQLISKFHMGVSQEIRIPINTGIAGHTATTGEVVNITNAYNDSRFHRGVDTNTGFHTNSILSTPVFNNRGEIVGVVEMINRKDGEVFDEEDINLLMGFNVFCGISLDNAKLYQSSLDLTQQLRGLIVTSSSLGTMKPLSDSIQTILTNSRNLIHASRATLYLYNINMNDCTVQFSLGNDILYGTRYAQKCVKSMKTVSFTRSDVYENAISSQVPPALSTESSKKPIKRVHSGFLDESEFLPQDIDEAMNIPEYDPITCIPLLTTDSRILGVMEFSINNIIWSEDIRILECFASFLTVALEKSELESFAVKGNLLSQMKMLISESERNSEQIPLLLKIEPQSKLEKIFTVDFDCPQWDGVGQYQVIWEIFSHFGLFEEFKITNERFFSFIFKISHVYNLVPYHNWRHAVDVTQFVTHEIILGGLDKILSKFEIFSLLVAAICHDANHDGFTNVHNIKAQTPLGILFKNQSVLEIHHCSQAIQVISREDANIFFFVEWRRRKTNLDKCHSFNSCNRYGKASHSYF